MRAARRGAHERAPGADAGLATAGLLRRASVVGRRLAVLLAVVSLVAPAFLVATARANDRAADRAIADVLDGQPPLRRDVTLYLRPQHLVTDFPATSTAPGPGPQLPFERLDTELRGDMGEEFRRVVAPVTFAAQSDPLHVTEHLPAPLTVDPPEFAVRIQSDYERRVRWTTGSAPGGPTELRTIQVTESGGPHIVRLVPVAVRDTTADTLGLAVGDVIDLGFIHRKSHVPVSPMSVVIAGTFAPVDPTDGFWQVEPRMLDIARIDTGDGGVTAQAAFLAPLESYAAIGDALRRGEAGAPPSWASSALKHFWRYPLDASRLTRTDVPGLRSFLVRLASGSGVLRAAPEQPDVITGLPGLLEDYERSVDQTRALTSFATAGIAALAGLVLVTAAAAAVVLRRREVVLLRSRGASFRQLLPILLGGPLLWSAPAAAAGVVVALALVPGTTPASAWAGVAVVVLAPVIAGIVVVRILGRGADQPVAGASTGAASTRRRALVLRRALVELAVVGLAVSAVATIRARATSAPPPGLGPAADATTGVDWYVALTPVLVALAAAVLLIRLLPWPLRAAARLAERSRGEVAFLGLSRASRAGTVTLVPVTGVVVGALVLSLLGALWTAVDRERTLAAYRVVGAPARVDGIRVTDADVTTIRERLGITAVAPAHVDPSATLAGADLTRGVHLVAVDPKAYADVVAGTPLAFRPVGGATSGRLPVIVSSTESPSTDVTLVVRGLQVPVERVAVAPSLARVVAGRDVLVALVPLDALAQQRPSIQANTAFVRGSPQALADLADIAVHDPKALGPLITGAQNAYGYAARVADRSLASLVTRTFGIGVGLASALTLLAGLLLLLVTRPDRLQLTRRLRTMGLRAGHETRLSRVEVLPVVGSAGLVGALAGWAAPRLLEPAIDLGPFTGGSPHPAVGASPWIPVAAGAAVMLLAVLALLVDVRASRRGLAEELRRGDR